MRRYLKQKKGHHDNKRHGTTVKRGNNNKFAFDTLLSDYP